MTAVQYEAAAYNIANATVAKFAKRIMDGLSWKETGGARAYKHIMQISSLTNQNSRATAQQARSTLFGQSILQNFVQLTSFDMADAALDVNMIL